MKYIEADLLVRKIKGQIRNENLNFAALGGGGQTICINTLEWVLKQITSLQQEQPEQDITEFEKALDNFGEAYATLVDRDNNPNQGIRINAYHELVQERINEILYLAKEYVKQEQSQVADASKMEQEVDLEKEIDKGIADYSFTKTIDSGGFKTTVIDYAKIARHFYELGLNARKEK